jgi:hypothetical protein
MQFAQVFSDIKPGHACQIEQPWLFDRFLNEFLTKHGLFPAASKTAR